MKERLGLGNKNSSPNSNRKQFWPMGRSVPTRTLLTEMRGGDLTTVLEFFLYFTMHKQLKIQQHKNEIEMKLIRSRSNLNDRGKTS